MRLQEQSKVGIRLNAEAVPVAPEVKGVCGMLGLRTALSCLRRPSCHHGTKGRGRSNRRTLRECPYSSEAAIIGEVTEECQEEL